MKDKYQVTIIVPKIEFEFDVYIPSNKKIGTIKKYILSAINELTDGNLNTNTNLMIIDKDTGASFDNNAYVKDSGIKNGTKIIIM